jgi:hypothetical protein
LTISDGHQTVTNTTAYATALLFACLAFFIGIIDIYQLDNNLSKQSDPFSEANAVRAAEYYVDNGITLNSGLPDQCYGYSFPLDGFKPYLSFPAARDQYIDNAPYQTLTSLILNEHTCVYTHYPQGPDMLLAAMMYISGKHNTDIYRLLPLWLQFIGVFALAYTICRLLSVIHCLLIMGFCFAMPMFYSMSIGLHQQGYAFALLLIEISLLFLLLCKALSNRDAMIGKGFLFILGFCQGWLSFDYAFLVILCPFAIVSITYHNSDDSIRTAIKYAIILASGFTLAHLFHFIEVTAYLSSIWDAVNDFYSAAEKRATEHEGQVLINRIDLLVMYLDYFSSRMKYFQIGYITFASLIILARVAFIPLSYYSKTIDNITKRIDLIRLISVIGCSLMISCLWIVVMKGHSMEHTHFIPRHLFLAYFIPIFYIVQQLAPRDFNQIENSTLEQGKLGKKESSIAL